jgi:hypothetical protein
MAFAIMMIISALIIVMLMPASGAGQHGAPSKGGKFLQSFCMNAGNASAMLIAIGNGIICYRTDISLTPGAMDFISNASSRGAQFLGILDYATLGVRIQNGTCISLCNWTLNDWNATVENALMDYPEIHTWEIWNEPVVQIFQSGYENGSAKNYFNMIKSASVIIKAKYPNDTIVCFGGAQLYPIDQVQIEYTFYRQVWNYGASKYCDAVSLHAYTQPYYNFSQNTFYNVTMQQVYNSTLNLYENMTKKPIWITETGIPSNNWTVGVNYSEQKQASFLTQDFDFFTSYPFVKRIYWFHLADSYSQSDNFGVLNYTLKPKPSWEAFLYFSKNGTSPNATV